MRGGAQVSTDELLARLERNKVVALDALRQAAEAAAACRLDRWEYAVEMEQLLASGLTITDLRLFRCEKLLEAAVEITPTGRRRRFRKLKCLALPPRSCLVLTAAGDRVLAKAAQMHRDDVSLPRAVTSGIDSSTNEAHVGSAHAPSVKSSSARPHWDTVSRILHVGDKIVKRLRRPASSQATILDAFEEEGWPPSIYDPLPPHGDIAPKRRLHNAINKLNSGLAPVIHFSGNGDGLAVCWEIIESNAPSNSSTRYFGTNGKPVQR